MYIADFLSVFPRPYERRGVDGGELQVGDRFRIERSGFEGFGAVDRDRSHLVVGADYVERQLNYSAAVDIVVPGGIAGLKVEIESPALNAIGITTLNIFNETAIPGLGISYEDLGLSCGAQVQYQKTCVFNITNLVPMILVLEQMGIDASLIYCQHTFNVTVTDLAGQSTTQPLIFDASKVTLASADLWANTATLALKSIPSNATSVSVQYKKSTETTWQDATVSNDKTMATITPEWSETTPYQINPDKGVFAATTYDYKLDIDGTEFTGQFTTAPGMTIANGNMDTWYSKDNGWYPHSDASTGNLWATGNPGTCTITDNNTGNRVNTTQAPLIMAQESRHI